MQHHVRVEENPLNLESHLHRVGPDLLRLLATLLTLAIMVAAAVVTAPPCHRCYFAGYQDWIRVHRVEPILLLLPTTLLALIRVHRVEPILMRLLTALLALATVTAAVVARR